MTTLQPRAACGRCGRPVVVCFCDRITLLPTRHRLLLLQHPRERRMGIGTARLAHLALPGSQLRVGLDFSTDPVVCALLAQRDAIAETHHHRPATPAAGRPRLQGGHGVTCSP